MRASARSQYRPPATVHTHPLLWDVIPRTLYQYRMTRAYPYSVGCYCGTSSRPT